MLSIEELKNLDITELEKHLAKERFNLYKILLAVKTEKKHPPSDVKKNKKYIARIMTVINQKKQEPVTQ